MTKQQLTPREEAARPYVIEIVRRHTILNPITADCVMMQLRQLQIRINKRSIRNIASWSRKCRPPFLILYTSGKPGGYYFARTIDEAQPYLDDSGSRAFDMLMQRRNISRYLRRNRGQEELAL